MFSLLKCKTFQAHLFWSADICPGKDVRADEILGGARAGQAGLRPRHDRVASQGEDFDRLDKALVRKIDRKIID